MIEVQNLVYSYNGEHISALAGIDLKIIEGEYVAVTGPIGCGKTTLIKHFNALLLPTQGNVLVDGMNTRDINVVSEIRRRVGMVFQNPDHQIVGMTVEEDVAFGPENLCMPSSEITHTVATTLEAVGLGRFARRQPHTLSGGEKRLLTIAGILAMSPKYILLDEPASSLDPSTREIVLSMIRELNDQGMAMIHVTHHLEEITGADRVIIMEKGRIVFSGKPGEALSEL